jgi:hypothetical protein
MSTDQTVEPDTPGPSEEPVASTAVLWISGLAEAKVSQRREQTARRIAVALDNESPAQMRFIVSSPTGQGDEGVSTIVREANGASTPVIDVFELSTEERLVAPVHAMNGAKQLWLGTRVVWGGVLLLLRKLRSTTGKTPRERWQLLYALGLLAVMSLGLIALLGGIIASWTADDVAGLPGWLGSLVLAVGGWGVWKLPVVKRLRAGALTLYAVQQYAERAGDSGQQLRGDVSQALNDLQSHEYKQIVVMAYSFGALLAVDACYSPTARPPERLADVDVLVTIGCPYDLVRALIPDYAAARFWRENAPGRWLNVYSPSDVLSSNFRNDAEPDQPTVGVPRRDAQPAKPTNFMYLIDGRDAPCGPVEALRLRGFKFHGQYWNASDEAAETVFVTIVPEVFGTE